MPSFFAPSNKACTCTTGCTGYGTQKTCPPLIVIAVLAVQQTCSAETAAAR